MKAGAADCVEAPIAPARLLAAVAAMRERADRRSDDLRMPLTRGERIVLRHVLEGRTTRQIADLLCRSPRTIEVHRKHILKKLGAANLIELVKQARYAGLGGSADRGQQQAYACAAVDGTDAAADLQAVPLQA
jgi:DNA-binding NarL/FixJ family response regulator